MNSSCFSYPLLSSKSALTLITLRKRPICHGSLSVIFWKQTNMYLLMALQSVLGSAEHFFSWSQLDSEGSIKAPIQNGFPHILGSCIAVMKTKKYCPVWPWTPLGWSGYPLELQGPHIEPLACMDKNQQEGPPENRLGDPLFLNLINSKCIASTTYWCWGLFFAQFCQLWARFIQLKR